MRILAIIVALAACDGAPSVFGPGLDQKIRVADAQLVEGAIEGDQGGPAVSQVLRPQALVRRGDGTVVLRGRLAPGGVAVHLQAAGDDSRWVLGARGFDFVVGDELQWSAELGFSYAIADDELDVRIQAADADGVLGPVSTVRFTMADEVPPSQLLVSLAWDAPSDVDLHVMDPSGVVIGAKNINSYEPPDGQVPPPDAWMEGGYLDLDSNQQCRLDLRNRENIVWLAGAPPPGRYRVYAQLFSACGQPVTRVVSVVQLGDEVIARADSALYEFDAREHPADGEAPGLLLAEFDVP